MGSVAGVASAVEVRDLHKSYGDVDAVRGVSFTVDTGEIVAVLGPNGAGKTTTIEMLEGFRAPTSGDVRVLGTDPATGGSEFRARIGIVLQEDGIDRALTVREALDLYRSPYPSPRPTAEVLDLVGLGDRPDVRVSALSGGQRRRLDLALGIVGDPELIFLDEPTTGFDPAARRQSWELIARLRELGKTILLTTHYMDEAQHLADRVVVLAKGQIVAAGTPDELGSTDATTLVSFREPAYHDSLPLPDGATVQRGTVSFRTTTPTADLAPVLEWAAARGMELEHLTVARPTLEDVYLDLTASEEVAA